MKSIKTKIIVTVILCSLVSTFICGAISIVNSVSTSYEDSQQSMQQAGCGFFIFRSKPRDKKVREREPF